MKNCPFCNAEVADDVKFCTQCGGRLDGEPAENPSQEIPVDDVPSQETPVDEAAVGTQAEETAYTPQQEQTEARTYEPLAPAKKKSPAGAIIAVILIIAVLCGGYFLYKYLTTTPYDRIEAASLKTAKQESSHTDAKISVGMQGMTFDVELNGSGEFNNKDGVIMGEVKLPEMLGAYIGITDVTFIINRQGDKAYITIYPTDTPDQMLTYYQDMTEDETLRDFDIRNIKKFSDFADIFVDVLEKQFDEENDEKLDKYLDADKLRSAIKTILTAKNMGNYCTVEEKDGEYHVVISAYKFAKYALDTIRPAVKPDQLKEYDEAYDGIKNLEENDFTVDFVIHVENKLIKDFTIKFENEDMSINATFEMSGFGKSKVEIPDDVKASYKDAQPLNDMFGGMMDDDYDDMD